MTLMRAVSAYASTLSIILDEIARATRSLAAMVEIKSADLAHQLRARSAL